MSKQYSSDQALHDKIMHGVNTLADNVAATLGPRGRNVILHQKGKQPIVTKDGVTVAKFVDLDDPVENVGAQIIKEAASQTNAVAGDGTTTATVLSRAILIFAAIEQFYSLKWALCRRPVCIPLQMLTICKTAHLLMFRYYYRILSQQI